MIKVKFIQSGKNLIGFEASGHSMSAPKGEDVICAFVSSACLMTANTVTEVIGLDTDAKVDDGYLKFVVIGDPTQSQVSFDGLKLHLTELSKDYPHNIKVSITEV